MSEIAKINYKLLQFPSMLKNQSVVSEFAKNELTRISLIFDK